MITKRNFILRGSCFCEKYRPGRGFVRSRCLDFTLYNVLCIYMYQFKVTLDNKFCVYFRFYCWGHIKWICEDKKCFIFERGPAPSVLQVLLFSGCNSLSLSLSLLSLSIFPLSLSLSFVFSLLVCLSSLSFFLSLSISFSLYLFAFSLFPSLSVFLFCSCQSPNSPVFYKSLQLSEKVLFVMESSFLPWDSPKAS